MGSMPHHGKLLGAGLPRQMSLLQRWNLYWGLSSGLDTLKGCLVPLDAFICPTSWQNAKDPIPELWVELNAVVCAPAVGNTWGSFVQQVIHPALCSSRLGIFAGDAPMAGKLPFSRSPRRPPTPLLLQAGPHPRVLQVPLPGAPQQQCAQHPHVPPRHQQLCAHPAAAERGGGSGQGGAVKAMSQAVCDGEATL